MKLVITSSQNVAGMNVVNYLINNYGFDKTDKKYSDRPVYKKNDILLCISDNEIVEINDLDEHFNADFYVFPSTHTSKSGKPSLTAHSTGNFGRDSSHGGNPRELGFSPANLVSTAISFLEENKVPGYEVVLEATHHGPTSLKKPLLFVEVGSGEEQWNHEPAFKAVGGAVMKVCETPLGVGASCIGFGGGHYPSKFTKEALDKGRGIGHICPKYNQHNLSGKMIEQMIEKTVPKPTTALVDKKGTRKTSRLSMDLRSAGLEVNYC